MRLSLFLGAAFFCPACGANSAHHTFLQTLAAIRIAAGTEEILGRSLEPDHAEVLTRALLEKDIQDAVVSFQRLAERLHEQIANALPEEERAAKAAWRPADKSLR